MSVDDRAHFTAATASRPTGVVFYPESDGKPMADNTRQWELIVVLVNGLRVQFRDQPDVLVAGDILWYPYEGNSRVRISADALVAFGRPKGHRGSYLQWLEGNVAPQVVFEVLSPGNRAGEMRRKLERYDQFGVEEYYVLNPDTGDMQGWLRREGRLQPVSAMQNFVSPRLRIRFFSDPGDAHAPVKIFHPDGRRFATAEEFDEARRAAESRAAAEAERAQKEAERAQKEAERSAKLAEKLRSLRLDPDSLD